MEEFREGSRNDPRIVQVMMMIMKMMMRMMGANKNKKKVLLPPLFCFDKNKNQFVRNFTQASFLLT